MILSCKDITKSYGTDIILKKINFNLEEHEKAAVVGVNGAGKTTLMRLICGVLQPTTGNIYYDGMEIAQMGAEYRRLLGYLPQELGYYDNFTAERFSASVPADMVYCRALLCNSTAR